MAEESKYRATRYNRSAAAERHILLHQTLESEAQSSFDDLAARLRRLTASRKQTPSETLLREGRDER